MHGAFVDLAVVDRTRLMQARRHRPLLLAKCDEPTALSLRGRCRDDGVEAMSKLFVNHDWSRE